MPVITTPRWCWGSWIILSFYICLDISSVVAFMRDVFSEGEEISKDRRRKFYSKVRNGKTLNQNKYLQNWSYHILKVKVSMPLSLITIAAQSLIKSLKSLYCVSILKSYPSWATSLSGILPCCNVAKAQFRVQPFLLFLQQPFQRIKGPQKKQSIIFLQHCLQHSSCPR